MIFMNDYDVAMAERKFCPGSAKFEAVQILKDHMEVINSHSDGWSYWKPPVAAARRLMEVIQSPSSVSELTARECLKASLRPLRAFYTKHPELPKPESL